MGASRIWRGIALAGALVVSGCGIGGLGAQQPATPTPAPTIAPTVAPVPTKPAVATPSPSPTPQPTATPEPVIQTVWVGNTDGEGVFLRSSPSMGDRLRAYPDKTPMTIIGEDVDGDDMRWHHVKAPDGQEGYVPEQYTTTAPP